MDAQEFQTRFDEIVREEVRSYMNQNGLGGGGATTRAKVVREIRDEFKLDVGDVASRFIRANAVGSMGMDPGADRSTFTERSLERTIDILKGWQKQDLIYGGEIDKEIIALTEQYATNVKEKVLLSTELEAGAALIPPMFYEEIIELLRTKTVVRAMGAVSIPVTAGTLQIPVQTGAGTAYYVGEAQNITMSQQSTGILQFVLKKLAALTPQSNDLIRDGNNRVDQLIRDDLTQVLMIAEDKTFLRGAGTENAPMGIRYLTHSDHIVAATATITRAGVQDDLTGIIQKVKEAEIPLIRPGWIVNPRTEKFLLNMRDQAGWWYREEMTRDKTIEGHPYMCTTQIPTTLGTNADETEVYFGDFAQLLIGEGLGIEMTAVPHAAYHDGSKVVSGLSTDVSVIRAISRHDFKMKYDRAFGVLTGVKWNRQTGN